MDQLNLFHKILSSVRTGLRPAEAIVGHGSPGLTDVTFDDELIKREEILLEEELVIRVLAASREPGFRGTAAAQWLLERRFKERWGSRVAHNPTAHVEDVKALTDEKLEALANGA